MLPHADVIKENQVTFLLFLLCRQVGRSANFRRNSFSFGLKVRTLLAYELKGLKKKGYFFDEMEDYAAVSQLNDNVRRRARRNRTPRH
jgi:hypothetical protein